MSSVEETDKYDLEFVIHLDNPISRDNTTESCSWGQHWSVV